MKLKVYGQVGCSKCTEFKSYCEKNEIEYEYKEDLQTLKELAKKHHIYTIPVVVFDDGATCGFNGAKHRIDEVVRRRT